MKHNPNTEVSTSLHKDKRNTVVFLEGKIYDLILSEFTFQELKNMDPENRPHVRLLNPIPIRNQAEQAIKNKDEIDFHSFYLKSENAQNSSKLPVSLKSCISHGVDPKTVVETLLKAKKQLKMPMDKSKIRKINRQLRKLGYKRYKNEEKGG